MLPRGLLREHSQLLSFVLRMLDVSAVVLTGIGAYYYRFGQVALDSYYQTALIASAILTLVIFQCFSIYTSSRSQMLWSTLRRLLGAIVVLLVSLAGLAFITKTGTHFSRIWFTLWSLFSLSALFISRCGLLILLRVMRAHGLNEKRVIIIGAGKLCHKLVDTVQTSVWTGFRIMAIFDEMNHLEEYIAQHHKQLDEIWLTLPLHQEEQVKALLYSLRHYTLPVRFVIDTHALGLFRHTLTDLAGFPTLNINASPMTGLNRIIKAIEDRLIAGAILLAISPLMLFIALGVRLSSKGPIFFKQLRHGWDGRLIKVYKFRTMVLHEEVSGQVQQATLGDKRITRFGLWLRRTSLDELPQFLNVLQGRMSIVGPRPHAVQHNEFYKDSIHAYMQRHQVKPGITGWAQVNGWRGETDTLEKMQKRIEYDLFYIQNWSLLFDLKIIFLTLFRGFINKNAY